MFKNVTLSAYKEVEYSNPYVDWKNWILQISLYNISKVIDTTKDLDYLTSVLFGLKFSNPKRNPENKTINKDTNSKILFF